jgi:hypothetical protein
MPPGIRQAGETLILFGLLDPKIVDYPLAETVSVFVPDSSAWDSDTDTDTETGAQPESRG